MVILSLTKNRTTLRQAQGDRFISYPFMLSLTKHDKLSANGNTNKLTLMYLVHPSIRYKTFANTLWMITYVNSGDLFARIKGND